MLYFNAIEMKLRKLIGLDTKNEHVKFGIDWSNNSLLIVMLMLEKCLYLIFLVSVP